MISISWEFLSQHNLPIPNGLDVKFQNECGVRSTSIGGPAKQFLDLWDKLSLFSKQHLKVLATLLYMNTQELLDTGGMRNFLVYLASQNSSYRAHSWLFVYKEEEEKVAWIIRESRWSPYLGEKLKKQLVTSGYFNQQIASEKKVTSAALTSSQKSFPRWT